MERKEPCVKEKLLCLFESLVDIVPPRSASDRTGLWNICQWLGRRADSGEDVDVLIREVLIYAQEAGNPECRKPGAVFVSLLKRRMAYAPLARSSPAGGPAGGPGSSRSGRPHGGGLPDRGR